MPVPPDYEPTKKPSPIRLPQLDWVFLLIAGILCVHLSNGDLTAIGNQLTGAALTAFKVIAEKRTKDDAG